jgi:two-component system, OmpR family, response regulator
MDTRIHLLVVDDDHEIRFLLTSFLERSGYRVTAAPNAREAKKAWKRGIFRLVVLDIVMVGESGLDLARWLRDQEDVPIVMLSAMGDDIDRIVGLELGADDYITKPFNPRELLARIRAVIRRSSGSRENRTVDQRFTRSLHFAGWTLDLSCRRLLDPEGVEVLLTSGDYDLLYALLERPHRVVTRDMLLDLLRGHTAGPYDRAIDVAVSRLRRKLDDRKPGGQIIKTVRGGGYVLATTVT